jgi:hypothetical protein
MLADQAAQSIPLIAMPDPHTTAFGRRSGRGVAEWRTLRLLRSCPAAPLPGWLKGDVNHFSVLKYPQKFNRSTAAVYFKFKVNHPVFL